MKKIYNIFLIFIIFQLAGCKNSGISSKTPDLKQNETVVQSVDDLPQWSGMPEVSENLPVFTAKEIVETIGTASDYELVKWEKDQKSAQIIRNENIYYINYSSGAGKVENLPLEVAPGCEAELCFYELDMDQDNQKELAIQYIKSTGTGALEKNLLVYNFSSGRVIDLFDEGKYTVSFTAGQKQEVAIMISNWIENGFLEQTAFSEGDIKNLKTEYFVPQPVIYEGKTFIQVCFKIASLNRQPEMKTKSFCSLWEYENSSLQLTEIWFQ